MKLIMLGFVVVYGILLVAGCENSAPSIKWRCDTAPIVKRVPLLSSCTNMFWHGEIITKDSFLSAPGPSAYRVCCFIPHASHIMPSLLSIEPSNDELPDDDALQSAEKVMLMTRYAIDLSTETVFVNERLKRELLHPPYWGQCIYFRSHDVLCIILFGE